MPSPSPSNDPQASTGDNESGGTKEIATAVAKNQSSDGVDGAPKAKLDSKAKSAKKASKKPELTKLEKELIAKLKSKTETKLGNSDYPMGRTVKKAKHSEQGKSARPKTTIQIPSRQQRPIIPMQQQSLNLVQGQLPQIPLVSLVPAPIPSVVLTSLQTAQIWPQPPLPLIQTTTYTVGRIMQPSTLPNISAQIPPQKKVPIIPSPQHQTQIACSQLPPNRTTRHAAGEGRKSPLKPSAILPPMQQKSHIASQLPQRRKALTPSPTKKPQTTAITQQQPKAPPTQKQKPIEPQTTATAHQQPKALPTQKQKQEQEQNKPQSTVSMQQQPKSLPTQKHKTNKPQTTATTQQQPKALPTQKQKTNKSQTTSSTQQQPKALPTQKQKPIKPQTTSTTQQQPKALPTQKQKTNALKPQTTVTTQQQPKALPTQKQKSLAERRRREAIMETPITLAEVDMNEKEVNECKSLVMCFLSGIGKGDDGSSSEDHTEASANSRKRGRDAATSSYVDRFQYDRNNHSVAYHYSAPTSRKKGNASMEI